MKICLVTEDFYPDDGAVGVLFTQLVRYLSDTYPGLKIDVVTSARLSRPMGAKLPLHTTWDGVDIFRLDARRSKRPSLAMRLASGVVFALRALRQIAVLHRTRHYDLLFVSTNPPSLPLVAQWMLHRAGLPYLYLVHDVFPEIAVGMGALRRRGVPASLAHKLQRKWLVEASAVVVVGRCMQSAVAQAYGLPTNALRVIPNWSDIDAIRPLSRETEFRTANDVNGFLVIYSGNIGRAQSLDAVLNAARILRDRHPQITFVLVGSGGARKELASQIEKWALKNVRMIPSVPWAEYTNVLASADVSLVTLASALVGLAVPSKIYNLLASGRPIIAVVSRESEIALLIREHQCGFQVDHDDGTQLAEAVTALYIGGSELRERLGRAARTACANSYTLQIVGDEYYRLFQELVRSGSVQV